MQISVVILNFNGSTETLNLLNSLNEQTNKDFEIIVVDNASEEDDFTNLQKSIHNPDITMLNIVNPQVKIMRNSENLGFSGGNNTGIRQALNPSTLSGQEMGSDWVVLLNNDTWVERDFAERLKAVLGAKTRSTGSGQAGVVGIPLVEGDRVAYCGKIRWLKPTLSHINDAKAISNFQPVRMDIRPGGFPISNEFSNPNSPNGKRKMISDKCFYAIGGAMAIHKDVFEKIGLLDEKYFLYFEDADFSVRARKAGFDISIADNLSAHHHISSSAKKLGSPLLMRYHYRNALYFNFKNGPWYVKLAVWPWSWIIIIKQLSKIAVKHNTKESKAILAGVIDFYKKRYGKIKNRN